MMMMIRLFVEADIFIIFKFFSGFFARTHVQACSCDSNNDFSDDSRKECVCLRERETFSLLFKVRQLRWHI